MAASRETSQPVHAPPIAPARNIDNPTRNASTSSLSWRTRISLHELRPGGVKHSRRTVAKRRVRLWLHLARHRNQHPRLDMNRGDDVELAVWPNAEGHPLGRRVAEEDD